MIDIRDKRSKAVALMAVVLVAFGYHAWKRSNERVEQNKHSTALLSKLASDNTRLSNELVRMQENIQLSREQFNELLALRGKVGVLKSQNQELLALYNKEAGSQNAKSNATFEGGTVPSAQLAEVNPSNRTIGMVPSDVIKAIRSMDGGNEAVPNEQALIAFLGGYGVNLDPGSLTADERTGSLYFRASEESKQTIKEIFENLIPTPP